MNPAYHIYEQIDRYLKNEMSEQELADFNSKIATDEDLKELVEAQEIANHTIINNELINLKQRMKRDFDAAENNSTNWTKIIGIVSLLIIAGTYSYIKFNDSSESNPIQNGNKVSVSNNKEITKTPEATASVPSKIKNAKITAQTSTQIEQSISNENLTQQTIVQPTITTENQQEQKIANSIPSNSNPIITEEKVTVDCKLVKISAETKVYYNDDEATIIIDKLSVKGGLVPYSYAIDDNSFGSNTNFSSLKDGSYHIRIKDQNNCISALPTVIVKMPAKEIDEVFAPDRGEKWKFPIKKESTGNISIINKAGSVVFKVPFSGGYSEDWDGRTNGGVELESGNYYFVIQYSDGETLKGHISIIR